MKSFRPVSAPLREAVMTRVVLNQELRAMLGDVTNPFHIFDEAGRPVLYVAPAGRSLYEGEELNLSDEELTRREQEGGRSWPEILADLEAKYPSHEHRS